MYGTFVTLSTQPASGSTFAGFGAALAPVPAAAPSARDSARVMWIAANDHHCYAPMT